MLPATLCGMDQREVSLCPNLTEPEQEQVERSFAQCVQADTALCGSIASALKSTVASELH